MNINMGMVITMVVIECLQHVLGARPARLMTSCHTRDFIEKRKNR